MVLTFILLILVWILPYNGIPIHEQRSQSQLLKYIAALLVVFGHETLFYCDVTPIVVEESYNGNICVAFFLFMSGYGLLYGHLKKGTHPLSITWIGKRLIKLIFPALTAMILYLIVKICCGRTVDWINVLKYWFVSNDNLLYGWYVPEIICLYIAFFLCYHWQNRYSLTILSSLIIISMIIMIILQQPVWYITGLPCFMMGLFLARHDIKTTSHKKIRNLSGKLVLTVIIIAFFFFKYFEIVQHYIKALDEYKYMYASYFISTCLFTIIIAYILMRLPDCKRLSTRLNYFYEIYLVQGATLLACRELISSDMAFIPIGIIVTIIVAKLLSVVDDKAINLIDKKLSVSSRAN